MIQINCAAQIHPEPVTLIKGKRAGIAKTTLQISNHMEDFWGAYYALPDGCLMCLSRLLWRFYAAWTIRPCHLSANGNSATFPEEVEGALMSPHA